MKTKNLEMNKQNKAFKCIQAGNRSFFKFYFFKQ